MEYYIALMFALCAVAWSSVLFLLMRWDKRWDGKQQAKTTKIMNKLAETIMVTPGMDKPRRDEKLNNTVYVVCEVKMSYDTEIVGVFSTQEEAEKYCKYKRIVGGDSFFYAEAHGVNEKKIPTEIGVEIIEPEDSSDETIVDFFDSEKYISWARDKGNENVIKGSIRYNGESIETLRELARLMKEMVVE